MAADAGIVRVTVVRAQADGVRLVELELAAGATVGDAVARSGLLADDPSRERSTQAGVFGEALPPDAPLRDGDRVEIYSTLRITPQEARRLRAARRNRRSSLRAAGAPD